MKTMLGAGYRCIGVVGALLGCTIPCSIRAQRPTPTDVLNDSAVPRPDSYTHYWPGACLEAVSRTDAFSWRARLDTIRYTPASDTMLTISAAVAQDCVTQFDVATVNPRDLILLARTYLAAGNESAAAVAMTRRLASEVGKPDSIRAATLARIVSTYINAKPARLQIAKKYLVNLNVLRGPEAAYWQLAAYGVIVQYSIRTSDDSLGVTEAEAMIAAGRRLSARDRAAFGSAILTAYEYLADLAGARTGSAAAPKQVIARARADLGTLQLLAEEIASRDMIASLHGMPAPRVSANSWYGTVGDTVHPRPGKVALIVFNASRENVPALRRISHAVPDTVDIVLVRRTYGYFQSDGPLEPPEETEATHRYFMSELHAPGTLAVTRTAFEWLPDGRRSDMPTENELRYSTTAGVGMVLVDRAGVIRRVYTRWSPWVESQIAEAVKKL